MSHTHPKPVGNQCVLCYRSFAPDGSNRPQDGPKLANESTKRCPRPKTAPTAPQYRPKVAREELFQSPTGGD
eukprot:2651576-Pyramimonas_sp.AAC.1